MDDFVRVLKLKYKEESELLERLKKRERRLERYKGDRLHCNFNNSRGTMAYYVHHKGEPDGVRHYCNKKQIKHVQNIQEYKYLEHAITLIQKNLKLIDNLLKVYKSPYPDDVAASLAAAYKDQSQAKHFLFGVGSNEEWLKEQRSIKAEYLLNHPDRYAASLTHTTSDGTNTRSKSELDLYHLLLHLGCTFIYEMPIELCDKWYVCDFLVLLPNGKLLIIEHMGLAGDKGYLSSKLDTLDSLIRSGWIPNVNLLLTFEDAEGNIDMQAITKLIMAYVC